MALGILILIALLVPLVLTIREIFKQGWNRKTGFFLVISIAVFAAALILYIDGSELQQNFEHAPKLFLLEDKGTILAGIKETRTESMYSIHYLTKPELDELNTFYQRGNLERIKGNHYKLIILGKQFLLDEITFVDTNVFSAHDVDKILSTSQALQEYVERLLVNTADNDTEGIESVKTEVITQVREETKDRLKLEDDTQLKGMFFATLFMKKLNSYDKNLMMLVLEGMKQRQVIVHKQTVVFTLGEKIPTPILGFFFQPSLSGVADTAGTQASS